MNCNEFKNSLTAFLDDDLSAEARLLCEDHLSSCEQCLQLWQQHAGSEFDLPDSVAASITAGILSSTGVNPCETCEESLCDFTDGVLERGKRHYVKLHLNDCNNCQAIANTLSALSGALPELAEVKPSNDLAEKILQQTSREPEPHGILHWIREIDF
ncbi:MAG: zf-HC2 domain-containing protein [Gammaproteobacteria bacterium]|jgi:predicted anti-sigma-YlaC factor YlaD|nr:hypothetical protein [Gammaproteobacteria bacterium]MDP6095923.1 zf-HC2 domain-containing protein [Gammaproteobacteria bacterium]HJO11005.1 zf-HC2 domain-containing protein [Gammaproteobacteria bacterium]|tara:strand:- start:5480 stop:5950 length:471 start_codon:yes stop_codon:yes gene_type:complete